jgi:hypothetical protein
MHDCAKDIIAFHDEDVTLKQDERTAMRNRRNANRERLKKNLKEKEKPSLEKFIKQGSYAMLTMVQDSENDYDIDDGVYFTKDSLKDESGKDMNPEEARQMVCDALKDGRFNKQPQVRKNCVRIFYEEGYHVDMPIYRIIDEVIYELAMGDTWTVSRAADVEDWFKEVNQKKSPDKNNGGQFRRIVRLLKKFARSRADWKEKIASGFTITKLTEECYQVDKDREDKALRETMQCMYNRLLLNIEVDHPVTPGAKLTKGPDDESTKLLRSKLLDALNKLTCLDNLKCTRKDALAAWDKVFNADFFSSHHEDDNKSESSNAAIYASLVSQDKNPPMVDKKGGGTFA